MGRYFLMTILGLLVGMPQVVAQGSSLEELDASYFDWFNKDPKADKVAGISLDKVYNKLLKGKTPEKTVLVAVIDSGVDIEHEDLEGKIWINEDEVAANGIDDDGNGYIDDIHGWNFLGNSNGENVQYENLEETRIVAESDNKDPLFASAKASYDEQLEENRQFRDNISAFVEVYQEAKKIVQDATGVEVKSIEDLEKVSSDREDVEYAVQFLRGRFELGLTDDYVQAAVEYSIEYMDYYLEPGLNARDIIGDDPTDITDRNYGNPDVRGPDATHGTGVAGTIAAIRGNGIGINGVTEFVKIMPVRAVPQGDERDKDVALAIRYAVDNGADIINMSFGKNFSPQKSFVDDAVRYAEEKGVLLVHASGNDGRNIDESDNFPTSIYADGKKASHWLEIGANSRDFDESIAASFSNYGKQQVDLFAPGASIVTLDLDNTYSSHDGTSFAAPITSGVAALILAYYSQATPQELIQVLTSSVMPVKKPKLVMQPTEEGDPMEVSFGDLSGSGGILNAYQAMKTAKKTFK
ncbi:MAG: S8 family peptidase [Bacteroidota bacterium]